MAATIKNFNLELYQEHLEEAAFLYEQRLSLLRKPASSWLTPAAFEDRLEAHLDALAVGGAPALEVCKTQALEGGFAELYVAVSVFCRQRQANLVAQALFGFDAKDAKKLAAVGDALKYEFPLEWRDFCAGPLTRQDPKLLPILANLCAYKRLPFAEPLLSSLAAAGDDALVPIIRALGRLNYARGQESIWRFLQHPSESVCYAALLTLLRLGDKRALQACYLVAQTKPWPLLAFGLAGGRSASGLLQHAVSSGKADADGILAIGLLGDIANLAALHACLAVPKLAEAAAFALNLITGAELYEKVFIPEEIEENELFDHELRAYREENKPPTRADGKPFGSDEIRLSLDPEAWVRWFRANASKFNAEHRYRNGKLFSLDCLLENLLAENSSYRLRALACEELAIRYGAEFSFEADMPVSQQQAALGDLSAWVEANRVRFQAGYWYFAGRITS